MTPSLGQPRLTIPKSKQINPTGFLNLKFYEPLYCSRINSAFFAVSFPITESFLYRPQSLNETYPYAPVESIEHKI